MVGLAILVALALQTTLGHLLGVGAYVNLGLVVVLFTALTLGPVWGLLAGSVAGLAQDTLSGGVLGIGGLAAAVVGLATGITGTQFIVANFFTRLTVFVLASLLYSGAMLGLYRLVEPQWGPTLAAPLWVSVALNGLLAALAFKAIEWWPEARRRRRLRAGVRR